ncbi:MAG: hypothetical protein NVSMB20_06490 [Bradyrhizobium sp.]
MPQRTSGSRRAPVHYPFTEHLPGDRVARSVMIANRRVHVAVEAPVNRKAAFDPSALLASFGTGLVILAFGSVWFFFLRGLTALGRMVMVWHFYI